MKIYLCGPITGLPDLNRSAFKEAAKRLNLNPGVKSVNPHNVCLFITANHSGTPKQLWKECMKADIRELLTCDGVALLPGWQESKGANIERKLALQLGIECLDIEMWYKILGV